MTYLELPDIESLLEPRHQLAFAELIALVLGESGIDNLPIDERLLTDAFVLSQPMIDRPGLNEEPQFALQAAKEQIESTILEEAKRNSEILGDTYPFEISPRQGILLQRKLAASENIEGMCYMSMQIYLLHAEKLLSFGHESEPSLEDPANAFLKPFAKLFEVISGIAVANHRNGLPVLLSESRSFRSLIKALGSVCSTADRGQPKTKDQLNPLQKHANDGGIDAVVLRFDNNILHETTLVGATIQKDNIRQKMIGHTQVGRFRNFLLDNHSMNPMTGSFAHPDQYRDHARDVCAEANCTYYHRELILRHLRPLAVSSPSTKSCQLAARDAAIPQLRILQRLFLRIGFVDHPLTQAALAQAVT
jgi:hypothetical protein